MPAPKMMHGSRAKVCIVDADGKTRDIGIWSQFSYQVTYDVSPAFIIGRFGPAGLFTTGVEPVSITAQGYRVVDHGPYTEGRMTNLKDLLNQGDILIKVYGRADLTGKKILAQIKGCLPTGTSSTVSAKQLQDSTNTYIGMLLEDESGDQGEVNAASLPTSAFV